MTRQLRLTNVFLLAAFWLLASTCLQAHEFDGDGAKKAVYDVKTSSVEEFARVLDRVSYLNTRMGGNPFSSSIVVVLHGDEINYLAISNELEFEDTVRRVRSLTMGETIEFRVCKVSAKRRGHEEGDLQSFVNMVPMADAEIVDLQLAGYAYMQ